MKPHTSYALTQARLKDAIHLSLILMVALLAWWPLLLDRPPVADDYFIGRLVGQGIAAYWAKYGIWRIFGHTLPFMLREAIPFSDRVLPLLTHLGALILFYWTLRRLEISKPLRIAASLIFAAAPFGFQALTWNSACSFALSTMFCLGAFFTVIKAIADYKEGLWKGLLAGALGFLSLISNESTLLVVPWVGVYPMFCCAFRNDDGLRGRRGLHAALLLALVVLAFEAAWVGLHLVTKNTSFHKNPSFYAPAIISGLLRQYHEATYLVHLPRLRNWLPAPSWWSAFGACLIVVALLRAVMLTNQKLSHGLAYLYFGVLLIAAPAVYSIAGGFSMDARKAYVLWPFILISGAFFLQAAPAQLQRMVVAVAIVICPILLLSSHAVTRIWLQTGSLFNSAAETISDNNLEGPYQFEWEPNPYKAWPDFEGLCGGRLDTRSEMESAVGKLPDRRDGAVTTLNWNPVQKRWETRNDGAATLLIKSKQMTESSAGWQ